MLTWSAVDCAFGPGKVKPKTIKLKCVAYPQSTQHWGVIIRAKTGLLGIRVGWHVYSQTVVSVN